MGCNRNPALTIGILLFVTLLLGACGGGTPLSQPGTITSPSIPTFSPTPQTFPTPATPSPSHTPLPHAASPAPLSTPSPLPGLSIPDPSAYDWQPFLEGLSYPVDLTNAGDGSGRLFVVEKAGVIRLVKAGSLLPVPFLDIRDRVGSQGSEQGLLGLVFHPSYTKNGYFYVNYTDLQSNTVIARYRVSANPDVADPASEARLLYIQRHFPNHNGGGLAFDPDGYLYIGLGDGGSEGDPYDIGQSLQTLLGKLLRIDVDHGDPYAVPADNPFVKGGGMPEIWAYGLRNPWRFAFDHLTGDLYIADVGQNLWEEIDYLPAGSPGGTNFGWSYREGLHPYKGTPPASLKLTDPVTEYGHDQGCAVTGGGVYRGRGLPAWQGVYFYGDFCSGNVWGLLHRPDGTWQTALLFETGAAISSFGLDQDGEVYLVDYMGTILRLSKK